MKKILALLISVLCAAGITFSLAGCGEKVTPPEPVKPPITENPEPESSMTFEEFISDHFVNALKFYNDNFSGLTAGKDLLAQTVSIGANSEDKLNSVTVTYTYKVDDTKRKIEKTTATITSPVVLDKIVDGSVAAVNYTLKTEEIFSFDVREVKENSVLAENLFSVANLNSDVKIFAEVESIYNNTRAFQLLTFNDGVYTVGEISVIVDNKSQENLLENMQKPSNVVKYSQTGTYSATKDGEAVLISSWYNFAGDTYTIIPDPEEPPVVDPENPPVVEEKIESIKDLLSEEYSQQVYQALNSSLLDKAGKQIYGRSFKAENIVDMKWDLGTSNTISEIKLISTYKSSSQDNRYTIATIKLTSSINVEDLEKDNILNQIQSLANISECNVGYDLTYGINELNVRSTLYEAIFETCDYNLTNDSTRIFIDNGYHTNNSILGESHEFKVVEITDKYVHEVVIRIKECSNDTQYKNYLDEGKNNNDYKFSSQNISFSDNIIKENAQKENVATTANFI